MQVISSHYGHRVRPEKRPRVEASRAFLKRQRYTSVSSSGNVADVRPGKAERPGLGYTVEVDVNACFACMRALGCKEHQAALPQQELNLIDAPVLHQDLYVAQELRHTIAENLERLPSIQSCLGLQSHLERMELGSSSRPV